MPEHTPAPTPHRAIYGYAQVVFFVVLFVWYLVWAVVPDSILEQHLQYVPDKYFLLFIPVTMMFALTMFGWIIYPAMNLAIAFDPDDERTLRDSYTIRRCKWVDPRNGRLCDKRTDQTHSSGWAVSGLCATHLQMGNDGGVGGEEDDAKIDDYCDCVDREHCMLALRPGHVKEMLARKTVPSVCDLDISDVCAQLFGDDT